MLLYPKYTCYHAHIIRHILYLSDLKKKKIFFSWMMNDAAKQVAVNVELLQDLTACCMYRE